MSWKRYRGASDSYISAFALGDLSPLMLYWFGGWVDVYTGASHVTLMHTDGGWAQRLMEDGLWKVWKVRRWKVIRCLD